MSMKKVTRIGIIILVIGISLLFVTVLRGSTPYGPFTAATDSLPAETWTTLSEFILSPRNLRIEITADSAVDLYILDENEVKKWTTQNNVGATLTFLETTQEIFTVEVNNRGAYTILVYNPSSIAIPVSVSMTLHGYERDLLLASLFLIIIGTSSTIISSVRRTKS